MDVKTGILISNLGSPDAPTTEAVTEYLTQFLTDRHVIDVPAPFRQLLVRGLIVPRRAARSAEAYSKIWSGKASPLVEMSESFRRKLQAAVDRPVRLAMRYGKPDFRTAIRDLKSLGVEKIVFWPLYPQFSTAATVSSLEEFNRVLKREWPGFQYVRIIRDFYNADFYVSSIVRNLQKEIHAFRPDHVLVSFHSLPNAQLKKWNQGCETPERVSANSCCEEASSCEAGCYRAQALATFREIGKRVDFGNISLSFQSRLGVRKWLKPATDQELKRLAQLGVKKLLVVCPGFVADNLETLEEIAIRGRDTFVENGGCELKLAPCLNDGDEWVSECASYLLNEVVG